MIDSTSKCMCGNNGSGDCDKCVYMGYLSNADIKRLETWPQLLEAAYQALGALDGIWPLSLNERTSIQDANRYLKSAISKAEEAQSHDRR